MERLVRTGLLYEFYGGLLTEKQQKAMELYYLEDWSLAEIAEAEGVSRQAVHDLLHRSEKIIEAYEAKLGLMERFLEQQEVLKEISANLEKLLQHISNKDQVYQELFQVNQRVIGLLEAETED